MVQKRFYIYNILLILSSLVYIIICLILIFKVTQEFPLSMGVNNYIRDNLRSPSIQDLIITRNGDCPQGYNIEMLATWPGSNAGCIDDDTHEVTSKCDTIEIEEISLKSITHWWTGYQFCVKRNNNYLFGYQVSCPPEYKKCAENLCVLNDELCPLTSITLQNNTDSTPNSTFIVYDYNKYFKLVREYNASPIISIQAAFYGLPCYADTRYPEGANYFPLISLKIGCGKYGQDFSNDIIETTKENVLYNFNGFDDVFTLLPGYKDFVRANNASLIARRKLVLKNNPLCYEGINNFDFGKRIDQIKSVRTRLIYILILEAMGILLLGTMIYRGITKKISYSTLKSDWKLVVLVSYIGLYGIDFAILAVLYPSIIDTCNLFLNNEGIFYRFVDNNCFTPDILNEACSTYDEYLNGTIRPIKSLFDFVYIAMIVRLVIIGLIAIITEFRRLRKYKNNQKLNTEENEPIYGDDIHNDNKRKAEYDGNEIIGANSDLNDVL